MFLSGRRYRDWDIDFVAADVSSHPRSHERLDGAQQFSHPERMAAWEHQKGIWCGGGDLNPYALRR